LAICHALWSQMRADFTSPTLRFQRIHMMPKPLQAGGVPIWVSGSVNPRVARRLAATDSVDPWLGQARRHLGGEVARMREALDRAGATRRVCKWWAAGLSDEHGRLDTRAPRWRAGDLLRGHRRPPDPCVPDDPVQH
jgi:alkanesulfonate monooxygenase SsuD/methylene tetrahydromethanopterin reductase-like flavin-dependent oxidoreductase (luciferase family)